MVYGVVVLCAGNGNLVQRDCGQAVNQVGFSSVFFRTTPWGSWPDGRSFEAKIRYYQGSTARERRL